MPGSLGKAHRYRALAEECVKLADLATDNQIRGDYRKISENYLVMARTELELAKQESVRKPSQG
jgi:hypothetical protein